MTHYYVAHSGDPIIYMATYTTAGQPYPLYECEIPTNLLKNPRSENFATSLVSTQTFSRTKSPSAQSPTSTAALPSRDQTYTSLAPRPAASSTLASDSSMTSDTVSTPNILQTQPITDNIRRIRICPPSLHDPQSIRDICRRTLPPVHYPLDTRKPITMLISPVTSTPTTSAATPVYTGT